MALSDQYLLHLELRDALTGKLRSITRSGQQLTEKLTSGQRRVQQAFRQTGVAAGRLHGSLTGLSTALSSLGLISGIAGAALAVKGLISTGASFEAQMSKVKALTGATTEEMDMLTDTARKLGQTTTFTAKQVAEAEGFAAMAGYTSEQINVALPAVLNLAKATGTDLAFAMDSATNIAAQFGFEASELPRVVDRVAAVTASANTNFQQLAEGMKFIGPTAQALGIDIEEAAAVVGKLASAGLQSSLGTRALSTSLVNLTKTTPRQENIMDAYGLNFFEDGNFVGIIGAIEQLEEKLKGVTQKERNRVIATLFNAEAIQEINILLQEGSDNLRAYEAQIRSSNGAAKRMADIMSDNLTGSWKELTSAVQEASLTLFEQFGGGLRSLVQSLTKLVRALTPHVSLIWRLTRAYIIFKLTLFATQKAMMLYGAAVAGASRLMRIARIATVSLSRAWRLLNVQIMRNPFALIASVAAIGISFLVDWALTASDAADAQKELNDEVAKMNAPVNKAAAAWTEINEAIKKGTDPSALSFKGFSVKELEYAKQQIAAFQESFKSRQLLPGLGFSTVLLNDEIRRNNARLASYKKLLPLIEKAAGKQRKLAGIDTQDVGLSGIKFDEFNIVDATAWDVLKKLKEQGGITIYVRGERLYLSLRYLQDEATAPREIVYNFERNVEKSNLKYVRAEERKVLVKVIGIGKDNKRHEATAGQTGQDSLTRSRYNVTDQAALKAIAEEELKKWSYTGYEGSLTSWLIPYATYGMSARLVDETYPEREGTYFIERVRTMFSERGGRREVYLGQKLQ